MPPVPYRTARNASRKKPFTVNQLKTMQRMTGKAIAGIRDARLFQHNVNTSGTSFLHGNHYVWNVAFNCAQGVANNNRVGAEIFLDGFLMNVICELPNTANIGSISYRIRVYADHDNTFSGAGPSVVQQINMQSVGFLGVGNTVTALNDKWQVKCLYDEVCTIDQSVSTGRNQVVKRKWIPIKKKVTYDTAGFLKLENYYFVVSPWISNGTLNSTSCGFFECTTGMYFKE